MLKKAYQTQKWLLEIITDEPLNEPLIAPGGVPVRGDQPEISIWSNYDNTIAEKSNLSHLPRNWEFV